MGVLLDAGVRAVQSTPLCSRSGILVGMLNTHYGAPHQFDQRESRILDLLVRQAADLIERSRAVTALRESQARLAGLIESAMDAIIAVDVTARGLSIPPRSRCSLSTGPPIDRFIPALSRSAPQHIEFRRPRRDQPSMGALGALTDCGLMAASFIEASISHMARDKKLFTVILRDITEKNGKAAIREMANMQSW